VAIFDNDVPIACVDMAVHIGIEGAVGDHKIHTNGDRGSRFWSGHGVAQRSCGIHPVGA
jgi:hypothetical protein